MPTITVQTIYDWVDSIAPFDTAESFDNVGLLIGAANAPVEKVMFCVDITEDAVHDAVLTGAQLIVSHHPLMFGGISRINYTVPEGRALCAILEARLNVICAHTNWDKAKGGTSDSLAEALKLSEITAADEYVRVGTLQTPFSIEQLTHYAKGILHADVRRYGETAGLISRVAVGAGACGDRAEEAILKGAQAFVVGETKHHELLFACGQGLLVLEAGHFASEIIGITALYNRFQTAAAENLWQVRQQLYAKAPFWGARQAP